jgi:thiol:disulfide interchange protein DsbC
MPKSKALGAALLAVASAAACATEPDELALLARLQSMYPATQWTSVTRTPIAGVYEAVMGSNLAYVGSDGRHFLFGHLFDMRTQTDLTAPKLAAVERRAAPEASDPPRKVSFESLPLADAIKTVHGNGTRVLALLSDPNCPYCRMLDGELAKLDDVTIYTFLLPWVSPDRSAADTAWAKANPGREGDTAVLDRNLKLAHELGLRGTPLLVAGDGRVSEGAAHAAELDAWLNADGGATRAADPSPPKENAP